MDITSKKMRLPLIIVMIIWVIGGIIIMNHISNKELSERAAKYHLVHIEDSFKGIVTDNEFQKETYLTLDDSIHIYFYSMNNPSYKPMEFYKFIWNYDVLEKHANSDTIYLYRANQQYYFIMSDTHQSIYRDGRAIRKKVLKTTNLTQ
ncbi:hypothetical protein FACS189413_14140 [Bacteroidia bacterium]|nr:hypothetical protein FACS189413_14140 [Bacteroidia bacterium]